MIELVLTDKQKNQWLNYETGYEQLHPNFEIIDYMTSHNYKYGEDWKCNKIDWLGEEGVAALPTVIQSYYTLTFSNYKIASTFILKWT